MAQGQFGWLAGWLAGQSSLPLPLAPFRPITTHWVIDHDQSKTKACHSALLTVHPHGSHPL